jgi:translation initiation factor 1
MAGEDRGGLGALLAARGLKMSEAPAAPAVAPVEAAKVEVDPFAGLARVVLSMERKGRGGKVVTLIRGVPEDRLEVAAKLVRKALGCGASVEADAILVQGDQRDRLRPWLERSGVRKIAG